MLDRRSATEKFDCRLGLEKGILRMNNDNMGKCRVQCVGEGLLSRQGWGRLWNNGWSGEHANANTQRNELEQRRFC